MLFATRRRLCTTLRRRYMLPSLAMFVYYPTSSRVVRRCRLPQEFEYLVNLIPCCSPVLRRDDRPYHTKNRRIKQVRYTSLPVQQTTTPQLEVGPSCLVPPSHLLADTVNDGPVLESFHSQWAATDSQGVVMRNLAGSSSCLAGGVAAGGEFAKSVAVPCFLDFGGGKRDGDGRGGGLCRRWSGL